jgi:hypothetical protein
MPRSASFPSGHTASGFAFTNAVGHTLPADARRSRAYLHSRDTRLLVARDVGQVRDVLRGVEMPEIVVGVYPTVDAGHRRRRHGGGWTLCGVRLKEGRDALSMIHLYG